MDKGKLGSLIRSSRFSTYRKLVENSKYACLTSIEKWGYRTSLIVAVFIIMGLGASAPLRGNEALENVILALIGTFSELYLAMENIGFQLSCFPLREILRGKVQIKTWQQVRALQRNSSLRAKIWFYAEGKHWCLAEDFGASFMPGDKFGVFRHPGMSIHELQRVGIFMVGFDKQDRTEYYCSGTQLISDCHLNRNIG